MRTEWADLPQPARGIAVALTEAVDAARAADPERYAEAVEKLAGRPAEQVGVVAGQTVRLLLEDRHAEGLTADDLRAALAAGCRSAAWYPELDPQVLATLLAGALGVHEAEGQPLPLSGPAVAAHAPLLLADLAGTAAHPLRVYLGAALAEIARSETMD